MHSSIEALNGSTVNDRNAVYTVVFDFLRPSHVLMQNIALAVNTHRSLLSFIATGGNMDL